ncbi:MAG: aminotransferase class IV, partial [Planctomycetota bacterium]
MADTAVFLDGTFVPRAEARISAFDAGVQHGVGLFETMTGVNLGGGPRVVGLREHLDRLAESARELRLSERLEIQALGDACLATVERSGLERCRLRLTLTGGDLNLLETSGRSQHRPTISIVAQPATAYPAEMFERGVLASFADARANPLNRFESHKTLNYWWRLRELQDAAAKGAGEAIVLQVSNHVAGGCVSSVIAIHGDRAMTPIVRGEEPTGGVPSPVLPGVTRAFCLGWLEEMGLEVSSTSSASSRSPAVSIWRLTS